MRRQLTVIILLSLAVIFTSCNGSNYLTKDKIMNIEEVEPPVQCEGCDDNLVQAPELPECTSAPGGLHSVFGCKLGVPISPGSMGAIDPDPTGLNPSNDYDGDGIPNDLEISTNPYVADYPRIVARISAPITMEIRINYESHLLNHTETVESEDLKDTITNSMEDRQYTQANQKTTPYVTKEEYADSGSHSEAYGYSKSDSSSFSISAGGGVDIGGFGGEFEGSVSGSQSTSRSGNSEIADSFSSSNMSEKTVFEDVDYVDNMDRNGVEFTNETVKNITTNYRKNTSLKEDVTIGPNAGIVKAALFIKNMTVNMPARVSNILCSLSFKTPAGEFLPVKTFRLRNDDWSIYEQDVYGGEEFGPFTVEIENLNTYEIKKALAGGYMPQIHVVSYDIHRVMDSNYNPGVDNLKIVEETLKGRTATIKIVGRNIREIFRVAAFDVEETDENGTPYVDETSRRITPGISLKKALFNIFRNRVGDGETWELDNEGNALTISDKGLYWKSGAIDPEGYTFIDEKDENGDNNPDGKPDNLKGNSWNMFETYIKSYTDEHDNVHRIETIKRIGELTKYNPFNPEDNTLYNPNELLSTSEIKKMKYWLIYHNGRYYEGDINDPIWAGERYEIVCMDLEDFNNHFRNYTYTPFQSMEPLYLDTRWNRKTNTDEFSRSIYLGKVLASDVVHLEVDLLESRLLFGDDPVGYPKTVKDIDETVLGNAWADFRYTFNEEEDLGEGVPKDFGHSAVGGINSMTVNIDQSQFADYYEIKFCHAPDDPDICRIVKKTSEELSAVKGSVIINSETKDKDGLKVGYVNDVYTGIAPGHYDVDVTAFADYRGVNVYTFSLDNKNPDKSEIDITDPASEPGYFTFNASGNKNAIYVRIASESNTEYYNIKVYGPWNYPNDNIQDPGPVIGHAGLNIIPIETPDPREEDMHPSDDPGVYKVEVYAVNILTGIEGEPAGNEAQFVNVDYERYEAQKEPAFIPRKSAALFKQRAVDLEVNFNDSSGWHRLKIAGDDRAVNVNNIIECRFTTYAEYNKQKFHIFFKPPTGGSGENYNVFTGGRQEADVYIRTVAEPQYRDTFWLKNTKTDPDYPWNASFIGLKDTGISDFIDYWIAREDTDASEIEDSYEKFHKDDYNDIPSIEDQSYALIDSSLSDFFFSPMEHRRYRLKAGLTEKLPPIATVRLDDPVFEIFRTMTTIELVNFLPNMEDEYQIFYRPGSCEDDGCVSENISTGPGWQSAGILDVSQGLSFIISDLSMFQEYVVAVVGFYGSGQSDPVFREIGAYSTLVPLEDASNNLYAFGSFGDRDGEGGGALGYPLMSRDGRQSIADFYSEGEALNNIFDTGISGAFDEGRLLRIVEDGKNIMDPTGLGLTPVMKSFADGILYPRSNQCYIDPQLSQFTLPQPSFWCRCESMDNMLNPEIRPLGYEFTSSGDFTFDDGKHGNAFTIVDSTDKSFSIVLSSDTNDLSKGAISFWLYDYYNEYTTGFHSLKIFVGDDGMYLDIDDYLWWTRINSYIYNHLAKRFIDLDISRKYYVDASEHYQDPDNDGFFHYYLVWDVESGTANLSGGKSFRLIVNNGTYDLDCKNVSLCNVFGETLEISSSAVFFPSGELKITFSGTEYGNYTNMRIDNIKWWNHVPSEDASFDYNAGDGNEDALHPMYKVENDFKPKLTGQGNGVGYYYLP